jgi:CRP-like cAMP-binding protein
MALVDDVRDLARNTTLRDLDPEALRLIAFSAETRILRAGDVLFERGDISDGGYVVLSGSIALAADGEPAIARPPMLIGDTALIASTQRPATATAQEPTTVLKISRTLFHRVLAEYPDSAVRLRQTLAARLIALGQDLDAARAGVFEG